MASSDLNLRLQRLRALLESEAASTQEDLREQMERQGFAVNQSTISRDLRRMGAVKLAAEDGRVTYRLAGEGAPLASPPGAVKSLGDLVRSIRHNGAMAVVLTDPGSASLVARHIDGMRSPLVMGTIAGDDAIFVAPSAAGAIEEMVQAIEDSFRPRALKQS